MIMKTMSHASKVICVCLLLEVTLMGSLGIARPEPEGSVATAEANAEALATSINGEVPEGAPEGGSAQPDYYPNCCPPPPAGAFSNCSTANVTQGDCYRPTATSETAAATSVVEDGTVSVSQGLVNETRELDPFTGVRLCAPVNILVTPSESKEVTDPNYTVTVEGEKDVIDGIVTEVNAVGILSITVVGNFSTNQLIKIIVSLPKTELASLNHRGPGTLFCLIQCWKQRRLQFLVYFFVVTSFVL